MTGELFRERRIDGFRNRWRRISRRAERDTFREVIMPAACLCGGIGALVLFGAALYGLSIGSMVSELTGVGLGLLVLPVVLFLYQIARGHFSAALDEP
jgi:hypothetical protein